MNRPSIRSALPIQRYQYGNFQVVLLSQIETNDPVQYHYLLAFVEEGQQQPKLYVSAEKSRRSEAGQGSHRLHVIAEAFDEVIEISNRWQQADDFAKEALTIGAQLLSLSDETPTRLG